MNDLTIDYLMRKLDIENLIPVGRPVEVCYHAYYVERGDEFRGVPTISNAPTLRVASLAAYDYAAENDLLDRSDAFIIGRGGGIVETPNGLDYKFIVQYFKIRKKPRNRIEKQKEKKIKENPK